MENEEKYNAKEKPMRGSGFDCPAIGTRLPKGTTFEYDSEGLIVLKPPKETDTKEENEK